MSDALALRGGSPVRYNPWPSWPLAFPTPGKARPALHADGPRDQTWKTRLEEEFGRMLGAAHVTAVNSGTSALDLAFEVLAEDRPGAVIASPYGHPASLRRAAADRPIRWVDISPAHLGIDPVALEAALREPAAMVVLTHVAGALGEVEAVAELCRAHGVPLVEDAAHAPASTAAGRGAGTFGALGCFSFHASKNLAAGEGGAVVASDEILAKRVWRLHDLGRDRGVPPYAFTGTGGNLRMAEPCAAWACQSLEMLAVQEAVRTAAAARLVSALGEADCLAPLACDALPGEGRRSRHFLPLVYRPEQALGLSRRRFVLALSAEGIACAEGWPRLLSDLDWIQADGSAQPTPCARDTVASSVWIDQRVLLDADGPACVLEAARKVQAQAGALGAGRERAWA